MMLHSQQKEPINEEIEEIRELVYNIVKGYPTGITSTYLEQYFNERYVQNGLAKPLPINWLSLLRHAEEFQVRDVSTYTILYLANANIPQQPENWENLLANTEGNSNGSQERQNTQTQQKQPAPHNGIADAEKNELSMSAGVLAPISYFTANEFEPVQLTTLSTASNGPMEIHILTALDPDKIYFRPKIWDPYCAYLYAALSRLPQSSRQCLLEPGQIAGANIDGKWERIELIRRSATNSHFWIVSLVDVGSYSAVHESEIRPLTEAVTAFKKIFLSVCKLDGVQSRSSEPLASKQEYSDESSGEHNASSQLIHRVRWPPETQHYVSEALQSSTLKNKRVEFWPTADAKWQYDPERTIPTCSGRILVDGIDFGGQLVSMGLAQRK